jgi:hypothetical protein
LHGLGDIADPCGEGLRAAATDVDPGVPGAVLVIDEGGLEQVAVAEEEEVVRRGERIVVAGEEGGPIA